MKNSQNSTRLRVARFWKFWKLIKININEKTNCEMSKINVTSRRIVSRNFDQTCFLLFPSWEISFFKFESKWRRRNRGNRIRYWLECESGTRETCAKEGSRDEKRCALRRTNGGQLVKFMLMQCRAYSNKYIQIFRRARFGMSVLAEPAYIPP